MSDIRIEIEGSEEFRAKMQKAPDIVREEMIKGVDRLTAIGLTVTKSAIPVGVSRNLARSAVQLRATAAAGEVKGLWRVGPPNAQAYADVIDKGRRPGRKMPPKGSLLAWIRLKQIKMYRETKTKGQVPLSEASVEFVIRRSIGRKGITGRRFMEKGRIQVEKRVKTEFAGVRDRIVQRIDGAG